jgi:Rrf2 family protein
MIKLSKKWNYALKSVIYIAHNYPDLLTIKNISEKLNISESLLRRIVAELEKWLILETVKWRFWWVKIKKDFEKISIFDILVSVWEDMTISSCTSWEKCENQKTCLTSNIFSNLQRWLHSMLKMQTLDKIISKK